MHFSLLEPFADLGLISLSDRRQMEEGVPMVFESTSGRLYYGTLPELLKNIPSSVPQKTPKEPSESSDPPQTPTIEQPAAAVTAAPSTSRNQKKRRQRKNRQKRREKDAIQSDSTPESNSDDSNDASTRRADEWMNTASSSRPNPTSPDSKLNLFGWYIGFS